MTNATYVYTAIQSFNSEETIIGIYATVEGAKAACEAHNKQELKCFDPAPLEWKETSWRHLAEIESCDIEVEYSIEKYVLGA